MQTKCEEELFVHKVAESPRRETQRARNIECPYGYQAERTDAECNYQRQ